MNDKIEEFEKLHKENNAELKFNPKYHTYTYGEQRLQSVTSFIKQFFKPFDADFWAEKKSKSLGMTPEEVKLMWKEKGANSIAIGNRVHSLAENYVNGLIMSSTDPYFKIITDFFDKFKQLKPLKAEAILCYPEVGIAGTVDLIMYDEEGNFYIIDWKTNEKIDINSQFSSGKEPLQHLWDNNYTHYSLQLNMYKLILEEKYKLNVKDLMLIHLKEDGYTVYKCKDLQEEVKQILKQ